MSAVAHKNLFELLGNDPDSDGEVKAPAKEVVKKTVTSKKKDVVVEAPAATQGRPARGGREYKGNEGAIRDREAGSNRNRQRPTENTGEAQHENSRRGGRGGARGGHRGNKTGQGRDFDRHSQTGRQDTPKQTGQGWGAQTGDAEWTDEKAADAIAKGQAAGAGWDAADPATAEPETEVLKEGEEAKVAEEPEEKTKTLEEYQAELAARKANLGPPPAVRRPNEGSRENKKWANAAPIKEKEEDAFIAPKEGKAKAPKERKTKQLLDVDVSQFDARADSSSRGGRGGPRGGRGGDRGDRGDRRGGPRGGRGGDRGDRGDFRGGERRAPAPQQNQGQGRGSVVKLDDPKAFPSLGA